MFLKMDKQYINEWPPPKENEHTEIIALAPPPPKYRKIESDEELTHVNNLLSRVNLLPTF